MYLYKYMLFKISVFNRRMSVKDNLFRFFGGLDKFC